MVSIPFAVEPQDAGIDEAKPSTPERPDLIPDAPTPSTIQDRAYHIYRCCVLHLPMAFDKLKPFSPKFKHPLIIYPFVIALVASIASLVVHFPIPGTISHPPCSFFPSWRTFCKDQINAQSNAVNSAIISAHKEVDLGGNVVRVLATMSNGSLQLTRDATSLESLAAAVLHLSTHFDEPSIISNDLDQLGSTARNLGKSLGSLVRLGKNSMRDYVRLYDRLTRKHEEWKAGKCTYEDLLEYRDYVSLTAGQVLKELQEHSSVTHHLAATCELQAGSLKKETTRQLRHTKDGVTREENELVDSVNWIGKLFSDGEPLTSSKLKALQEDMALAGQVIEVVKDVAISLGVLALDVDGLADVVAQARKKNAHQLYGNRHVEDILALMKDKLESMREMTAEW